MKFILIILDGFGLRDAIDANAYALAKAPIINRLFEIQPWSKLKASGFAVGLPEGTIGNSEVGHMTIGAGRIIEQELVKINHAIQNRTLAHNPVLNQVFDYVRERNSTLQLIGLVSDGGVHSHINHLFAVLKNAKNRGIKDVSLHAITDGRDTPPKSGVKFINQVTHTMNSLQLGHIATIMGRYYAMDRDKRWARTERAYRAMTLGEGSIFSNPIQAIESSYKEGITDEFIKPRIILRRDGTIPSIKENDALLFFNFRQDRMRQICRAFGTENFNEFSRDQGPYFVSTMTSYDKSFTFPTLFQFTTIHNLFSTVLEEHGFTQLRLAETEKYAHVTYFFNGGNEEPYPNEDRILIPSPKVATYDLIPEMSANQIKEKALEVIQKDRYDCLIMNLANPDMVGHTGDLNATISAVETVDKVVGEIISISHKAGIVTFVTSDHGNQELMKDPETGEIHTAHTTNPVPFFMVNHDKWYKLRMKGGLSDIAPTILDYLGIKAPEEMSGKSLLIRS